MPAFVLDVERTRHRRRAHHHGQACSRRTRVELDARPRGGRRRLGGHPTGRGVRGSGDGRCSSAHRRVRGRQRDHPGAVHRQEHAELRQASGSVVVRESRRGLGDLRRGARVSRRGPLRPIRPRSPPRCRVGVPLPRRPRRVPGRRPRRRLLHLWPDTLHGSGRGPPVEPWRRPVEHLHRAIHQRRPERGGGRCDEPGPGRG